MRRSLALLIACVVLATSPARALIMVGKGNKPVDDHHWPDGSLAVANLKARVGWWEGPPFGGGEWHFQYRGDQATFEQALADFGHIKAPDLQIVVHEGPGSSEFLKDANDPKSDASVDWEFTVWDVQSFHHLYNNPQSFFGAEVPEFRGDVPAPRLDVYVAEGRIDWSRVQAPAGVTVADERATANGYAPEDGNVLRGTAYDMTTGKPIPQVAVAIEKYVKTWDPQKHAEMMKYRTVSKAVGDADGRFEMKELPAGDYRAVLRCVGYAPRRLGYVNFDKQTLKTFTTKLSPATTLTGTAVDNAGKPVAGIQVRADNPMGIDGRGYPLPDAVSTTTDAAGKFTLAGLPQGHAQLFASATGYLAADILKLYDLPAKEPLEIRVNATGSVKGRVLLPPGGARNQVDVHIAPEGGEKVGSWGGSMQAHDDGTFAFDGVPPGKYYVSTHPLFGDPAKEPHAKPVTVESGKTAEIEIPAP